MGTVSKIIRTLTGVLYISPFFLFGLWLLQIVYFPQAEAEKPVVVPTPSKDDVFRQILADKLPVARGHYHIVDEYVSQPEPKASICLTCHGTYPHGRNEKIRSLLNSHAGFMACAVCHVRKDSGGNGFSFAWVHRETELITMRVAGGYGKYQAKIFPVLLGDNGRKRIFRPLSEEAAQQFLEVKDKYTPDQVAQAKVKLHEGISRKPVYCNECHKKEGYFAFAQLGFSPNRVNQLASSEIIGMLDKYETFYLPSVLDF